MIDWVKWSAGVCEFPLMLPHCSIHCLFRPMDVLFDVSRACIQTPRTCMSIKRLVSVNQDDMLD